MTTATPRPSEIDGTPPPPEPVATSAHKALSSPWASLAAVVIAVLWTIPTLGLLVTSFRPESDINTSGWWTFFTNPQRHLVQLRHGPARQRHQLRDVLRELDRDHDPGGDHPDQHRHAGGVRLRVDEVPGSRLPVRRDLRSADRADPGDPDPAAQALRAAAVQPAAARGPGRPGRGLLHALALAHDLRAATGDLPAAQLHEPDPRRADRVGSGRRRRSRADLHPDHAAADGSRDRGVRHPAVPVGVERPAGRDHLRQPEHVPA